MTSDGHIRVRIWGVRLDESGVMMSIPTERPQTGTARQVHYLVLLGPEQKMKTAKATATPRNTAGRERWAGTAAPTWGDVPA